jgi:hypothetical protein
MPVPQPPKVLPGPRTGAGTPGPKPGKGANPANPQGQSPNVGSSPASPCLISWPKASVPLVGSVGGGCLLSKTNVRAMAGGIMLGAGASLTVVGLILLVAAGFKRTGGLGKAAAVAGVIPGGQPVAAGLRGAQARVSSGQSSRPSRRARAAESERRLERAVGEPRENTNLREGQGAIRESPAGTRRRRAERDRPPF